MSDEQAGGSFLVAEGNGGGDQGGGAAIQQASAQSSADSNSAGVVSKPSVDAGSGDAGTQTPFFRGLYGEDGKINREAFDRLPEHLKPYRSTFEKYNTVEALLGGFGNLSTLAGKKGLQPLPDHADESTRAEFDHRVKEVLQIPKDPESYGITKPEGLPDEMWDPDFVKEATGVFHKFNVTPDGAKALVALDAARATRELERQQQAYHDHWQAQKAEIAQAFGEDTTRKLAQATQIARKLGLDPADPAIGGNAKLVIALSRMAAMTAEDRLGAEGGNQDRGLSPREMAKDIISNPSNPKHVAYHDTKNPAHQRVFDEVLELNRQAMQK